MVAIVIFYNLFRIGLASHYFEFMPFRNILLAFVNGFTIDCMAIGGFFAILLYTKNKYLKLIRNNYIFYLSLLIILISYAVGLGIPRINSIFYSTLYGILILNLATNPNIGFSLENRYTNYLGNISYGLYMLHPIALTIAIKIGIELNIFSNYLFYPLAIGGTIMLSALSYRYYESFFLKFKEKFQIVKSGSKN